MGLKDDRIQIPIHSADLLQNLINFLFHPFHLLFISLLLLFSSRAHGLKFKQVVAQHLECKANIFVYNSIVMPLKFREPTFQVKQMIFEFIKVLE